MHCIVALFAGLVFGLGLILSGMTDPENIQNFLDVSGNWDPALMFVMVGAIMLSAITFLWVKRRSHTILGEPLALPVNSTIDRRLVLGATLFGVGWGLAGFCPGPAVASLISQPQKAGLFVVSMIIGMLLFHALKK